MRTYSSAQGTLFGILWWLKWEGNPKKEGIYVYLWLIQASLLAQMIKNPPAMRETWVQTLGWEDTLEKGTATDFSIATWRIPWTRRAWQATVHGVTKSQIWLSDIPRQKWVCIMNILLINAQIQFNLDHKFTKYQHVFQKKSIPKRPLFKFFK